MCVSYEAISMYNSILVASPSVEKPPMAAGQLAVAWLQEHGRRMPVAQHLFGQHSRLESLYLESLGGASSVVSHCSAHRLRIC